MKTGATRESQAAAPGATRAPHRGVALAAPGHGMPAVALGISSGGIGTAIGAAPRANATGLPDRLKAGIETLSGLSMDDVRVHYNSPRPAQLQALAYTRGADIHVGPGQEMHLPHEAWHVVQQKQRRVSATLQMRGTAINDDAGLEREADVMGVAAARGDSVVPDRADAARGPEAVAAASATPVVQRRLKTQLGGAGITKATDLQQIASRRVLNKDRPSDGVKGLIASSETFYLPDTLDVDLAAPQIRVLEEKKYLLGEEHHSQAWEKRTAPWSYIPKMSEAYSAIHSETPQSSEALKSRPPSAMLPLEEGLTKAVGNALLLQHKMNDYSRIAASYVKRTVKIKDAALRRQGETVFWLCIRALHDPMRYVEANLADLEQVAGIKEFARFAGVAKTPWGELLNTIASIINERHNGPVQSSAQPATPREGDEVFLPKFAADFGPKSIMLIQDGLESYVGDILAIMTARRIMKPSDQFVTDARALGKAGSPHSFKWAAAVDPERERFMRAGIAGAPAPLLVQLGDAHRERLEQVGLPAGTVAVARCEPASDAATARDPFVPLTTRSITSTNWLAWGLLAAAAAAVAVGAALWLRSGNPRPPPSK